MRYVLLLPNLLAMITVGEEVNGVFLKERIVPLEHITNKCTPLQTFTTQAYGRQMRSLRDRLSLYPSLVSCRLFTF